MAISQEFLDKEEGPTVRTHPRDPLVTDDDMEHIRRYNLQLDCLREEEDDDNPDYSWKIKNILAHQERKDPSGKDIFHFKVEWIGGDKHGLTWMTYAHMTPYQYFDMVSPATYWVTMPGSGYIHTYEQQRK